MQILTDNTRVIAYESSLSAMDPTTLDQIIAGVSDRMVQWMRRIILQEAIVEEHDMNGLSDVIVVNEWPVQNITAVDGDGVAIETADLRVKRNRELYKQRVGERFPRFWQPGTVTLSYTGGYGATLEAIPQSLVDAATRQSASEARESSKHLIGITERVQQTGEQESFEEDGFLPSVVQAMRPFRRLI